MNQCLSPADNGCSEVQKNSETAARKMYLLEKFPVLRYWIAASIAGLKSSDLAVIEYTSGTTGESKGVMLSNLAINTVSSNMKGRPG